MIAIVMQKDNHHFHNVFATEQVAVESVKMTYMGGFKDIQTENIRKYGVDKKIHFTPQNGDPELTVIVMEPDREASRVV